MTKIWRCTKCNYTVEREMIESIQDPPTGCPACDHPELAPVAVHGRVHRTVEEPSWLWREKQPRRKLLASASAGVALFGGTWFFFGRPRVHQTSDVELIAARFRPRNIEIATGDVVTWTNVEDSPPETDAVVYRLRSGTADWDFSADIPEGESVSYTFDTPGVFSLYEEQYGDPSLGGMSMKIGVDTELEDPLGGWF